MQRNIPVNFLSSFDTTVCVAKTMKKDGFVNGGTVCWSKSPLWVNDMHNTK